MPDLTDEQLLRYSRHILLPEIGEEGQQKLANSKVLLVGLGGLGSPVALYLAASGIGSLIIADGDEVELSNLQRQILHTTATLGMKKTDSATLALRQINPTVDIETAGHLEEGTLPEYAERVDVVVDGSDSFATRYAVNKACRQSATPLVSGAVIRMEGQVGVFIQGPQDACYECLYPNDGSEIEEACVESGVLAPVAGIIGSIQAVETLKILADFGDPLAGKLLLLDAKRFTWKTLNLEKNENCPVCSDKNSRDPSH